MPEEAPPAKTPKAAKDAKAAKPKAPEAKRQDVTRRLRAALSARPLELPEMCAQLRADEDAVLAALRRLGKKKRGRLRSGAVDGRNCWWWEPAAPAPTAPATAPGYSNQ